MDQLPPIFRLAKEASHYSTHPRHKIGAVLLIKGKPCGVGFNSKKSHPLMKKYSEHKTLHAEISALLSFRYKDLKGATMVVYREARNGNPAMSRPCSTCQRILADFGIRDYIYSTDGGWATEVNNLKQ